MGGRAAAGATWEPTPLLVARGRRCEPRAVPLKVAMLLSGGVDSSLALHLLQAAGHEVTAFYLQARRSHGAFGAPRAHG